MKVFVAILVFIFLAPICIIAGFFGSCLLAGVGGGNESFAMLALIAGPLVGLAGSIALTVLIVRSMRSHA